MKKCILLILCAMALNGCFALTPYALNKVEIGMDRQELKRVMGKPYTTKFGNDKEYQTFYLHRDIYDLFITQTKFPFIGIYPLMRTGQETYVVLENGRVISYGDRNIYHKDEAFKAPL